MPKFLDDVAVERLLASPHPLQFRRDILPLVAKEVGWTYYHELFNAHGERTTCDVGRRSPSATAAATVRRRARRARRRDRARPGRPLLDPGPRPPARRAALRRPPRRCTTTSAAHVAADVARRTNPAYSADLGAFIGLLWTFGTVGAHRGVGQGRASLARRPSSARGGSRSSCTTPAARRRPGCASCWRSPTSGSSASSAPARRSRPTRVERRFVARSTSHDDVVTARAYVDARIAHGVGDAAPPTPCWPGSTARGEVTEEVVADDEGWSVNTGKVVVDDANRLVLPDGSSTAAPVRRRHVHEPPGRRCVRPAAHERPGVPPARRPRPHRADDGFERSRRAGSS